MAHAQKPDLVFQRNGRIHLYRQGCQFNRVLAFLECGSAENDCSNTGWTVPSQTEDCWLPTPFASFPFISPPVRRRVPPDSVSTLTLDGLFRVKLKTAGYPLHSPLSPSLLLPCFAVCHQIPFPLYQRFTTEINVSFFASITEREVPLQ